MQPWKKGPPQTLDELFAFYHEYVKVLYAAVQAENQLPLELLFELNAAFDHISRKWVYKEDEAKVISKTYGHLKRGCLDAFKIFLKRTTEDYKSLRELDTSAIDNGTYTPGLHTLYARISEKAKHARHMEGQLDSDGQVPAFESWEQVYLDCLEFHTKYFLHPHLDWAVKRGWKTQWKGIIVGLILGLFTSWLWCWVAKIPIVAKYTPQ